MGQPTASIDLSQQIAGAYDGSLYLPSPSIVASTRRLKLVLVGEEQAAGVPLGIPRNDP